jgi:hypothetical protein
MDNMKKEKFTEKQKELIKDARRWMTVDYEITSESYKCLSCGKVFPLTYKNKGQWSLANCNGVARGNFMKHARNCKIKKLIKENRFFPD